MSEKVDVLMTQNLETGSRDCICVIIRLLTKSLMYLCKFVPLSIIPSSGPVLKSSLLCFLPTEKISPTA